MRVKHAFVQTPLQWPETVQEISSVHSSAEESADYCIINGTAPEKLQGILACLGACHDQMV